MMLLQQLTTTLTAPHTLGDKSQYVYVVEIVWEVVIGTQDVTLLTSIEEYVQVTLGDDGIEGVVYIQKRESDEGFARKFQEEWENVEERNRLAEEEATNEALIKNFDEIKARIKADIILAEKLQEQEREQFTIEERAKFLHDTIAAQRKFLAKQRSEAIRNRPPPESIKKSDDDPT
ncbi:hypothetical protein Tco_0954922 [Tanacetum coccineum]|uniref:Uncharacterized protein n=1 Tax=Tanacetum coccineum TaxID=301880 RepID=A0ABQ5E5S3_9ASTR